MISLDRYIRPNGCIPFRVSLFFFVPHDFGMTNIEHLTLANYLLHLSGCFKGRGRCVLVFGGLGRSVGPFIFQVGCGNFVERLEDKSDYTTDALD